MEKDRFYLGKIVYHFYQEGNTCGTTAEDEELIVEVEGPVGSILDHGGFLVIRSTTGWSINNSSELTDLLKKVELGVSSEINNNNNNNNND